MSQLYIECDGVPVRERDLLKWGEWFETADRTVAKTTIGDVEVSTVFLGMDHQFRGGPPILYETMVFGGPLDGEQFRYSTRDCALSGHQRTVGRVKATSDT